MPAEDVAKTFKSAVCVKKCPVENEDGKITVDCIKTDFLKEEGKECSDVPEHYSSKGCKIYKIK